MNARLLCSLAANRGRNLVCPIFRKSAVGDATLTHRCCASQLCAKTKNCDSAIDHYFLHTGNGAAIFSSSLPSTGP
jgi:hypothetical protein